MKKVGWLLPLTLLSFTVKAQDYQNIYKTTYQKVAESVIGIKAIQVGNPLRGGTYSPVTGTGVILNDQGLIVTNKHVVERTRDLKVILYNNEEYPARLISASRDIDLAVIQISNPPPNLKPIILGDSEKLEPGEIVLALGNPAGLNKTLTQGIVSAVGRYIPGEDRPTPHTFIQTDAAINPGNSGGALVNLEGKLVGIPTLMLAGWQNISFAIPVNVLKTVLPQLLSPSNQTGWLGISTQELTSDLRSAANIPKNINGLVVTSIHPLSPAKNKLESLDVVTKVNNTVTVLKSDLEWAVRNAPPGTEVALSVFKSKTKTSIDVFVKTIAEPTQK
ncbi:MAG: trypsin-like peptidase domain-containing protein [Candidatus Yanofskybacteria bacterium]|nr:trypsin-like peptidase domain-containing protein [Candidatus Yanofskybacteria bacterium]